MELILIGFALILVVWLVNRWRCRAAIKLTNTVPSNSWHTLFGFGYLLTSKSFLKTVFEHGKKYGTNSVFWMGPYPLFLTRNPDTIKEVLTSKNCVDKPLEFYNSMTCISGHGLITESDPVWSQHRKLLNKAFSNNNLISFLPTFNAEIDKFVNELRQNVEKGEDFQMLLKLRILTLKNATKTTLKRDLDLTKHNSTSLAIYLEHLLNMFGDYTLYPFLTLDWVRSLAELFVYKTAKHGIKDFLSLFQESLDVARKNNAEDASFLAKENSVLDCFLQATEQNKLKEDEVQGLLMQFFIAAFETTSTTLYFALVLLAMHPEYQDRIYEEVSKVMNDESSELTITQLDDLIYLDMIFNETMRILPIVPIVSRKVSTEDLTLGNDITLPVGQLVAVDIFHLHRTEALWGPEAEQFNPDNFLPANVAARHPYAFIPFTKGQRFCIGWRYGTLFFKIALAKLIKTFKFSTDFEFKNLKYQFHITLKLAEEPKLKLERR